MIWMIGFWVSIILSFGLMIYNKKRQSKKVDFYAGLFLVYSLMFFIISIATKDPILEFIGVPFGYEWVAGLGVSGFGVWKYYLNPLKTKVNSMDREVGEIKTTVNWIKDNCKICKK